MESSRWSDVTTPRLARPIVGKSRNPVPEKSPPTNTVDTSIAHRSAGGLMVWRCYGLSDRLGVQMILFARKESEDSKTRREQLEALRYQADHALLTMALEAFQRRDIDDFKTFYANVGSPLKSESEPSDNLTRHEKVLDAWRICITMALVLALATAVFLVVRQTSPSGAAAAYVSLLSGLTGIALGWMFANSGDLKKSSSKAT